VSSLVPEKYIEERRTQVDARLNRLWKERRRYPEGIHEAMEFSVMAGGKRLRPVMCLATAETMGAKSDELVDIACALELVHTYSLVHDDLPAMDDDDFRRNRPTCHRVYGEAMAILAGDALLTLAFELLAGWGNYYDRSDDALLMVSELAEAAGTEGMIGGQVLDISAEGQDASLEDIEAINYRKTAALLRASVRIGGIAGKADPRQMNQLSGYATALGMAFQIADDLLDLRGDISKTGKEAGSDEAREKATYPLRIGEKNAENKANELYQEALSYLENWGEEADILRYLARLLVFRDK